jgi:sn-glycerol 3-phosphate transport system permease protein
MNRLYQYLDNFGAILLAVIWVATLLFAFWVAFHTTSDAVNFNLTSSWTLDNFA